MISFFNFSFLTHFAAWFLFERFFYWSIKVLNRNSVKIRNRAKLDQQIFQYWYFPNFPNYLHEMQNISNAVGDFFLFKSAVKEINLREIFLVQNVFLEDKYFPYPLNRRLYLKFSQVYSIISSVLHYKACWFNADYSTKGLANCFHCSNSVFCTI